MQVEDFGRDTASPMATYAGRLANARKPRHSILVIVIGLAALALSTTAPAASAEDTTGGLWYYYETGVADVLPTTPQGSGIKIALIDSAINPDVPELAGTNIRIRQEGFCRDEKGVAATRSTELHAYHATAMAALQVGTGISTDGREGNRGVAPRAEILHYQALGPSDGRCWANGQVRSGALAEAMAQAIDDGAHILSISLAGPGTADKTMAAIARANREGVVVVASECHVEGRGHRSDSRCWPAGGNGVVAVDAVDRSGMITDDNVYGRVTVVAPGKGIQQLEPQQGGSRSWDRYRLAQGSSPAAAWTAGVLATVWSKYPDATGNQMIQSLIRNAGTQKAGKPLSRDPYYGYGMVSITKMVQHDPRLYPDVNPLLENSPTRSPAYSDCQPADQPKHAAAVGGRGTTGNAGPEPWVVAGIGGGIVALVGGGIIVRARRRKRNSGANRAEV